MNYKTIDDLGDLHGKVVMLRADLNVPMDENFNVTNTARIDRTVPTIKELMSKGAKVVVISHFGRPEGKGDMKNSLSHIVSDLEKALGKKVTFVEDCIGEKVEQAVKSMSDDEVLLLENLRFYNEEKKGNEDFAKELVKVADFYGVSCDYLLGRTKGRNELDIIANNILNDNSVSDLNPSEKTFIKAGTIISQLLKNTDTSGGMRLDMLYAIALYKVILIQANAGNLPKNWCGRAYADGEVCCNTMYLGTIELSAYDAVKPLKNKNPVPDAPIPEAVKTLVSEAENFIVKSATSHCPPIPFEFMR
jgi:hypothetical protein